MTRARRASSPAFYALLIYAFIFLPVVVLVLFSFQGRRFPIPPFNGPVVALVRGVLADQRLTGGARQFAAGRRPVLGLWRRCSAFSPPGARPLSPARLRPAARPRSRAPDGELPDHRHGAADDLQRDRLPEIARSPPASATW